MRGLRGMGRARRLRRTSRWAWQNGNAQVSSLRLLHGFPLLLFSDTGGTREAGQRQTKCRPFQIRAEERWCVSIEASAEEGRTSRPCRTLPACCSDVRRVACAYTGGRVPPAVVPSPPWVRSPSRAAVCQAVVAFASVSGRPEKSAVGEPPARRDARKRRIGLSAPDPHTLADAPRTPREQGVPRSRGGEP